MRGTNDQIQPVRAGDSTQVKTVDRALGCNFLFCLIVHDFMVSYKMPDLSLSPNVRGNGKCRKCEASNERLVHNDVVCVPFSLVGFVVIPIDEMGNNHRLRHQE
jgi:hypothetical protein